MWAESRGALEYVRLSRDPIFRGTGVPDGHGRPVLLVPGFMAGDGSLSVLHEWLLRVGYHAQLPGLRFNVRYSELVMQHLTMRLVDLYARLGPRVTLVGHSRGGLLAKVLADRQPELVERVISLGAPLGDPYDVHPITLAGVRLAHAYNLFRYARPASVESRFLRDLEAPAKTPLTSIYSRTDGIVHWKACLRPDAECIEVEGSQVGLAVNRDVYLNLARILSTPVSRRSRKARSSAPASG